MRKRADTVMQSADGARSAARGGTSEALGWFACVAALAATSVAHADAGELTMGLGATFGVPVAGYLGPPGRYDLAARYVGAFQLSLDYAFTDLIALEAVGGVGALIQTADRPPAPCTSCSDYDGGALLTGQLTVGPKLRFLDDGALSLAVHVGLFKFDGLQFGADGVLGYDIGVGDRAALNIGLQYWLLAAGEGDPRQPGERQFDAAILLGIGGSFSFGGEDSDPDDDGVEGAEDRCPDEAEDQDGWQDEDGCPDGDDDGDGVPSGVDVDDRNAEDRDGFEDEDGVPDLDDDGDGVPDTVDACPREAGSEALGGCPARDGDHDGVTDDQDRCPGEVGDAANDGCAPPRVPAPTAEIVDERIEISGEIYFQLAGQTIEARSYELLNQVGEVMRLHPEIRRLRIEGHTDETGGAATNRRLSLRRAETVRDYLVERGIRAERFVVEGLGSDRPIVPRAATEEDRARNRRVEFHIESN